MRLFSVLLVAVLPLISGCVSPGSPARTDAGDDWLDQPWQLHCESNRTHSLDLVAVPGMYKGRWIWGQTDRAEDVYLDGELLDGFFHLHGARSGDDTPLPATPTDLRGYCLTALAGAYSQQRSPLGKVQAARDSGDIDVPILVPFQSHSEEIRKLVIFGDSLSDSGRLSHRMQVFPGDPYWLGRFSNGPVWPDYLGVATSLAILNQAVGGASVARPDHLEEAGILSAVKEGGRFFVSGSIALQLENYFAAARSSGGTLDADDTAYLIWAGANDYISKEPITGLITTFLNEPDTEMGYRNVVNETIEGIARQVKNLYAAGARKLVLMNLPDLGRTPIVLQNETYISVKGVTNDPGRRLELSRRLTRLSDYHNEQLDRAVDQLKVELTGAHILLVDSWALTDSILEGRALAGDAEVFDYGFALDELNQNIRYQQRARTIPGNCYQGPYLGIGDPGEICDQAARALFWDAVHPATYAHCWQAYQLWGALAEARWVAAPVGAERYRDWCMETSGDGSLVELTGPP